MSYFLVHDLGTTSDKAALFGTDGTLIASVQASYDTVDTRDGGFEQNPADWLKAVSESSAAVLEQAAADPSEIEGVSLSGHMMGVVALDRQGLPVRPAILHSDIRSRPQMQQTGRRVDPRNVHKTAGNPLDVHYPWLKIAWLEQTEPSTYAQSSLFVQSKDYVSGWLTGERSVTDFSDASLYGCFDFEKLTWSSELCDAAGIDLGRLPEVVRAGTRLGTVTPSAAHATGLLEGTPVYAGFGDGASAAMGSGSAAPGSRYCYIGSTAWVSGTTSECRIDPRGRLFTLALLDDLFALLGTVQSAGSAWDWAVTRLCESHFETAESYAASSPPGSRGLVFLPYLAGERAPIWNDNARGVWFGLSGSHGVADMLRSVLEGVSLCLASVKDDLDRLEPGVSNVVKLIGGGVRSRLWARILASALGTRCELSDETEQATARGAMMAVAVGSGAASSFAEASARHASGGKVVEPGGRESELYLWLRGFLRQVYKSLEPEMDTLAELRSRSAAMESPDAAV